MKHNLYQEELMDHYQHPRHKGTVQNPDFDSGSYNPSCGDEVRIQGIIRDGSIGTIAFDGKGCVISQAAASMLAERVVGRTVDEVMQYCSDDIKQLIKIDMGPTRMKCALLPLQALQEGIASYKNKILHE